MEPQNNADRADAARLENLNRMPREEAYARLRACCGSERWASEMADRRPFGDFRELFEAADLVWWNLGAEDWLAAFRAHPKIGERRAERETGGGAGRWSEEAQAGLPGGAPEVAEALATANLDYEARFGHIFIISASGKSPEEMLEALRRRLANDPTTELCVAAEQQRRITRLRLLKLLGAES